MFYVRGEAPASILHLLPDSVARNPESTRVSYRTPTQPWRSVRLSDAKNTPKPWRMMGYVTRLQLGNSVFLKWWEMKNPEKERRNRGGSGMISWCVFLRWDRCDGFSRCWSRESLHGAKSSLSPAFCRNLIYGTKKLVPSSGLKWILVWTHLKQHENVQRMTVKASSNCTMKGR